VPCESSHFLHTNHIRICLAVSKPWKRLLESSYKLWTTFDTTFTKRNINKSSLRAYLKRSNYTVNKAIISMAAKLDASRLQYLTRSCEKLRHLEFSGHSTIGESLVSAVPFAKSLEVIRTSPGCRITESSIESVLKHVSKTVVDASFLGILHAGSSVTWTWPKLESLKILRLRLHQSASYRSNFNIVSFDF